MTTQTRIRLSLISFLLTLAFVLLIIIPGCHKQTEPKPSPDAAEDKPETKVAAFDPSKNLWGLSIFFADKIEDQTARDIVYDNISERLATSMYFPQAIEIAGKITNDSKRALSFTNIAGFAIISESPKYSEKLLDDSLGIAAKLENPMEKASVLSSVASVYDLLGDTEKSAGYYDQAKQLVQNEGQNFNPENFGSDDSIETQDKINEAVINAESEADVNEFSSALDEVLKLNDLSSIASSLSYVAFCYETTGGELSKDLLAKIEKIKLKADEITLDIPAAVAPAPTEELPQESSAENTQQNPDENAQETLKEETPQDEAPKGE